MFRSWDQTEEDDHEDEEDQMMEDFTFGVASRHLGVMIADGDDQLMEAVLRKYKGKVPKEQKKSPVTVNEMLAGQATDDTDGEVPAPPGGSWLSRLFGRK